ncbi:MAG: PIN domain-containing protein [Synergistaceae bacterium]|jgi:predicted nucleic acid-binding protein|nr:PIN domain-containing protein [Synergistaceae bacterium]
MKLLLDTNIVVDILSGRDGYADSLGVLKYCEVKRAEGFVSAITVTDVMYILRKLSVLGGVRDAILTLTSIVDVADVSKADINGAFSCGMSDFEDAVQAMCAKRIGTDYIVTRNVKDFAGSPVQAILPDGLLRFLQGSSPNLGNA